jgi:4-oxalocrotonate tautomerase
MSGIEKWRRFGMPFVRIFVRAGTTPEYRKALGDGVYRAMVEAIAIPADDRFVVVSEHSEVDLVYDPQYLGVHRSDRIVIVQITMSLGRNRRENFFQRMAEILSESPGLRTQDLMTVVVETAWENWSFGNGEAHYMDR